MSEITQFRILVREVKRFAEMVGESDILIAGVVEQQTLLLAEACIRAHKEAAEMYLQRYNTLTDEWQHLERELSSGGGGGRDDRVEARQRPPGEGRASD